MYIYHQMRYNGTVTLEEGGESNMLNMAPVGRHSTASKYEWMSELLSMGEWPEDECILWPFATEKTTRAPQWALTAVVREVHGLAPSFAESNKLHSCGQSLCLNPNHVKWGSHTQNMADRSKHERSGHKLSIDDARLIRAAVAEGFTHYEVAHEFDVSRQTIHKIVHNITWKETA